MTDQTGAAPAAAEPVAVPIENPVTPPNPIESSGPDKAPEPVETKPPATAREALERAAAKIEAKGKEEAKPVDGKVEAKDAKPEQKPRDETGKFAAKAPDAGTQPPADAPKPVEVPKPSHTAEDAPARFTDTVKAKWHAADPELRGEVLRMEREFKQGFDKYKAGAERDADLNEYHELTARHGTTVKDAFSKYMNLEQALKSQDVNQKLAGIEEVFRHAGISPRDYAAHIMGQSPDQVQSQNDATVNELRQHIARLEQQLGGVTQTFQQQREQATLAEINKFAEDHPRFEELADDIAFFMKSGRTNVLSEAYELAERLNPAPATPAPAPAPVIPAQTAAEDQPKGSKSISGAPSQGSNPGAKRPPPKSNREALQRAFAAIA